MLAWLERRICIPAITDFQVTLIVILRIYIWQIDRVTLRRNLWEHSLEVVHNVLAGVRTHAEDHIVHWYLVLVI